MGGTHPSARRPGDTDIEPDWADEAFADDDALVESSDPASKSARPTGLLVEETEASERTRDEPLSGAGGP